MLRRLFGGEQPQQDVPIEELNLSFDEAKRLIIKVANHHLGIESPQKVTETRDEVAEVRRLMAGRFIRHLLGAVQDAEGIYRILISEDEPQAEMGVRQPPGVNMGEMLDTAAQNMMAVEAPYIEYDLQAVRERGNPAEPAWMECIDSDATLFIDEAAGVKRQLATLAPWL